MFIEIKVQGRVSFKKAQLAQEDLALVILLWLWYLKRVSEPSRKGGSFAVQPGLEEGESGHRSRCLSSLGIPEDVSGVKQESRNRT